MKKKLSKRYRYVFIPVGTKFGLKILKSNTYLPNAALVFMSNTDLFVNADLCCLSVLTRFSSWQHVHWTRNTDAKPCPSSSLILLRLRGFLQLLHVMPSLKVFIWIIRRPSTSSGVCTSVCTSSPGGLCFGLVPYIFRKFLPRFTSYILLR